MDIQDAIDAPRIHDDYEKLVYETRIPEATVEKLKDMVTYNKSLGKLTNGIRIYELLRNDYQIENKVEGAHSDASIVVVNKIQDLENEIKELKIEEKKYKEKLNSQESVSSCILFYNSSCNNS